MVGSRSHAPSAAPPVLRPPSEPPSPARFPTAGWGFHSPPSYPAYIKAIPDSLLHGVASVLWAQAGRLRHRPQRLGSDHIMLGIFFNVHSAVLIEDVPFTEKDFENGPQNIYNLYEQVSYNCFIAAGLYLLLGGFFFCQVRLNQRKEYMVR
ncbi:ribonuclease kappa isoform X1 [Camelus ferus]|uniref:Ribonuclease kappa isoform X1 n=2 Tax=Camelus TaxID=9836 RepID=A0A8B7K446_CAMFR|nr:ribonuclease kappa isoform X1 [Camelus ferus]